MNIFSLQEFRANTKLKGKRDLPWVPRKSRAPCKIYFSEAHVCWEMSWKRHTNSYSLTRWWRRDSTCSHTQKRQIRPWQHENGRTHQTKRPSNPVSCLCEWPTAKEDLKKKEQVSIENTFPAARLRNGWTAGKKRVVILIQVLHKPTCKNAHSLVGVPCSDSGSAVSSWRARHAP